MKLCFKINRILHKIWAVFPTVSEIALVQLLWPSEPWGKLQDFVSTLDVRFWGD